MKPYKKIFFFTLAAAMAVVFFVAGKHLLTLVLTIIWLLMGTRTREAEKHIEMESGYNRERQEELLQAEAELDGRYEEMAESTKKRRQQGEKLNLLTAVLITVFALHITPSAVLAEDDLYIPEDYNELKELYILADREVRERDELILEYQALIVEYKDSVEGLNELVVRLQEVSREKDITIAVMEGIIESYNEPGWGIGGGLVLGEQINYNLGITRLNNWWGWQANYISSGSLLLGLNIYF